MFGDKIEEIDDELVIYCPFEKKSKSVTNPVRSTHLEIPDREKGGIERKSNFINYFIVPWDIWLQCTGNDVGFSGKECNPTTFPLH